MGKSNFIMTDVIKIAALAGAFFAATAVATPALADSRHGRDYRHTEVFYRDGCRVEREWRGRGRYEERIDCGRRNGRGWRSEHRDYDDRRDYGDRRYGYDDRRHYDDRRYGGYDGGRFIGAYFGDGHRGAISRHYGRDCDRWRADWGRPYRVGYAFPTNYGWRPVGRDIYAILPPPPRGHYYRHYNDDVLLIREAGRIVVDAILASDRRDRW